MQLKRTLKINVPKKARSNARIQNSARHDIDPHASTQQLAETPTRTRARRMRVPASIDVAMTVLGSVPNISIQLKPSNPATPKRVILRSLLFNRLIRSRSCERTTPLIPIRRLLRPRLIDSIPLHNAVVMAPELQIRIRRKR